MEEYPIMMGDEQVGVAEVVRQGLYYHMRCHVRLSGQVLYRIIVTCGRNEERLGILAPEGNEFGLEKRLPVKRIGDGPLSFRIYPKHGDLGGKFVPLAPEEPFRYLARVKESRLVRHQDTVGLLIPKEGCG